MPCYRPLNGWYSRTRNKSGKRSIVFSRCEGLIDRPVQVPCGQCIGCRLERSRSWAMRCVHEASLYEDNCFITLTFADGYLPSGASLVKSDFQKFMKRLRKEFSNVKIRYFHCGEYGENFMRPHHHACLFGFDFPDRVLWTTRNSVSLYRSAVLERLWPFGFCTVGGVTFESAAYVARYVTKKITGEDANAHYGNRLPEYVTMSRRPGIGREWIKKNMFDVFPSGAVVVRGDVVCRPPRYYENIYDVDIPNHGPIIRNRNDRSFVFDGVRYLNKCGTLKVVPVRADNTSVRLEEREKVQKLLLKEKGVRNYEKGYV